MADSLPAHIVENRCVFHVVSSANYHYSRSVRHVQTYVCLMPARERGLQRVGEERLQVAPLSQYAIPETADRWGNRVVEVRHDQIDANLTVIADLTVQTAARYTSDGKLIPTPIPPRDAVYAEQRLFREFTRRTHPSQALERAAHDLQTACSPKEYPFRFATAVAARIHEEMEFTAGATTVGTTASEAWENRRGVCQDFSHIALALFRLSGVPARYVSGFVPGEGVMHAWVEVLLTPTDEPDGPPLDFLRREAAWYAIDPTYNRWRGERGVTVAVGRDFGDITPVSGTYFGAGATNELSYGTKMELVRSERVLL